MSPARFRRRLRFGLMVAEAVLLRGLFGAVLVCAVWLVVLQAVRFVTRG